MRKVVNRKRVPLSSEKAFVRYSALCASQECCSQELAGKMGRNGMEERDIAQVLQRLADEDFLNEERYARAFVQDKLRFNHWGRQRIRMELCHRKIAAGFIDEALAEIEEKQYNDILRGLLETYNRSVKATTTYEHRAKLMRHAYSRGFSPEEAGPFVNELVRDN